MSCFTSSKNINQAIKNKEFSHFKKLIFIKTKAPFGAFIFNLTTFQLRFDQFALNQFVSHGSYGEF